MQECRRAKKPGLMKTSILFVCTGNAGRSQIAQALFGAMIEDSVTVVSAGVDPWPHIHPVAQRLLQERGVDTTELHPKHVAAFADVPLDWVVTIGDRARHETPPVGGNPTRIHWDISDPADADGTGQEREAFQRAQALIENRLPDLLKAVKNGASASHLHLAPGVSTCIVRPHTFDPAAHLPVIAAAGFKCIELNCYLGSEDFPWDRPARVSELARISGDYGVEVYSVHAEGGIGGCRGGRSERVGVDLYKSYADLAAEVGAPVVVCHAEPPDEQEGAAAVREFRSSLEDLSQHVLEMPCRYGLENLSSRLSPAAQPGWISELDPGAFGFVFDNGHSNLAGTTDACLNSCNGLLCDLHLNDNDGKSDVHGIPGSGSFPWKGFMEKLESTGYVGPLMLEVEARDRQGELASVLNEAHSAVGMVRRKGDYS